MAGQKETAYVLPEGVAASTAPQYFQGVPGEWTPGEPVRLASLGVEGGDFADLVDRLGLPLEKVDVDAETVDVERTGGLISGADLRSDPVALGDSDRSPIPGLTEDEFRARVAEEAEAGTYSPVVEAALRASPEMEPEVERSWPTDHAGFDALAKELGYEWPEGTKTLAEKQAALEAAGYDAPVTVSPAPDGGGGE